MDRTFPISCLPVSFFPQFLSGETDIRAWSATAKSLGLDYIDINAFFFRDIALRDLEKIRGRLAIPVFMVTAYSDFSNPDIAARRRALRDTISIFEAAGALGAACVRLTAGQYYPETKDEDTIINIYSCFEACIIEAERRSLTVLYENHSKPGAWAYPDFNFHMERFLALWGALKELPLAVNFDTANAFALGRWDTLLQAVAGRIKSVHVNDISSLAPLVFCCVGEGLVCIETILRKIVETGFCGTISIEEASGQGEEGLRRAILNTKRLCKSIG